MCLIAFPPIKFEDPMADTITERKVVVVGDSETGKTSLLFRVSNADKELPMFHPTIMDNQVIT